jgi:hypothetical protein
MARIVINPQFGFQIDKNEGTISSPIWSNSVYIDNDGNITVTGNITGSTITGGTITGSSLRTASSGARIEITDTGLTCYSTGTTKSGIAISNDINIGWGDLKFYNENVLEGGLQYNSSDAMVLYSNNGKDIGINSDSNIYLNPNRSLEKKIYGIRADNHSVGVHNHGIANNVHLATVDPDTGEVNGMVEWQASGGFILDHNIY